MSADGSKKSNYSPFTVDSVTGEINFNGKVTFSNVTGASSSANMLYNSAPAIGLETKGWRADYNSTGLTSSGLLATGDPYRPTGYGAFHQYINGTPAVGKVFDIRTDGKIPVIGGQYYEASAYLNTHRCNGQIYIQWNDAAGAVITWSFGMEMPQTNAQGSLANWGRVNIIKQAPANATSCYFFIRGISTGEAYPHVFVSMCYFGRASEGQNVISNWSEGISAGVSSNEVVSAINSGQTTTIDGGKITTGSITASQIAANSISADRISSYNLTAVNASIQNGMITNAMIGDAQINNAKIANLSVNTIKIADQAVTIPFSVLNTASVTVNSEYVTVASISTVSSGAPTTLTFSCNLSAGSLRAITARVIRNGTVLYDAPTTSVGQSAGQYGNLIFVLKDIPPVGTNTYVFDLYSTASNTTATYASIIGLEVKK